MTQQPGADSDGNFFLIVLAVFGLDFTVDGIVAFLQDRANPLIGVWHTIQLAFATLPLTITVIILVALFLARDLEWRAKAIGALVMFLGFPFLIHLLHLDKVLPGGRLPILPSSHGGLDWLAGWVSTTAVWYYRGYGTVLFLKSCVLGLTYGVKLAG